ncbi:MAG: alpha/beta fold hydrolase, partial [Solirubrobacteraceae bacterium]
AIPGSRLAIFDGVGHLPQLEAPGRFVAVLERFLAETEPAQWDIMQWRARLIAASEECERREGADETGATNPPLTRVEAA